MSLITMRKLLLLAGTLAALPAGASAQVRASERSTLSQTIDGTVISLDFARPRVRGRAPIFGGEVKWDEVWTPGANWATTLNVSKPITIDGHAVPKGKYSVWMQVRDKGYWTLILDPDSHKYHEERPDSTDQQIRFPVRAGAGPMTEVLTWSFPELRINGGVLAMQWADMQVKMDVRVEPSYSLTTPAADAKPYVGRYTYAWKVGPGEKEEWMELAITYENGSLYGEFTPQDPYFKKFIFIRLADGSLTPALFDKGELYEIVRDMVLEFKGPKDRPDVLEVRDDYDEPIASGKRKN